MRRRVFVVAAEYSENPRYLTEARRAAEFFAAPRPEPSREEVARAFFRFPNRGDDARTKREDWERAFGLSTPIGLGDLFASAAHRALTTLCASTGGDYLKTRNSITDLFVTSMPGLEPNERLNVGLVPQALRADLGLRPRARAQFVVGTSDSGAWAFAQAVRTARTSEDPATMLVVAGQIIPSGYVSQYQIRSVLGEEDQEHGLDMLVVGDLVMDLMRRNYGLSRGAVESLLARTAARKAQAGAHYPAGIHAGRTFKRDQRRTPYFDAGDIAVPCCGAAAVIVTSDEELVASVAASKNPRFRTAPIMEVLGVGEGSSNSNFLRRKSPLLFTTAVREALADTADDARMPGSTFASCAFGVVHDAFPSIELSFLLGVGLGWERAAERMAEGWSNPVGGLLTFGHALGASGLVQVNKVHHLFCVDRRYLPEAPGKPRQGFREDGALAFATSVGGPLSHVVGGLFRGGYQENRLVQDLRSAKPRSPEGAPVSHAYAARRTDLRHSLEAHLRSVPGSLLVEGTTYVSVRSCLRALTATDIQRLTFDGIQEVVVPGQLDDLRRRLRSVVAIVQQESTRLASMFDVFRLLTDEVRDLAGEYRSRGWCTPLGQSLGDDGLADRLKECLRVPLVAVCRLEGGTMHREVRFLPFEGQSFASLDNADLIDEASFAPRVGKPEELPFWNVRADRPEGPPRVISGNRVAEQIIAAPQGPRTRAELELMRLWFAPDAPRALLEKALRQSGAAMPEPSKVRAMFYLGELAGPPSAVSHEVFSRYARQARAYLEAYESTMHQVGSQLSVVAFERPPFRTGMDEALLSATRFSQEIARSLAPHGLTLRAAVCIAEGEVFEGADGRGTIASTGAARVEQLLEEVRAAAQGKSALAIEGASNLLVSLLDEKLGWPRSGNTWVAP
jgi:hypothetical protein